MAAKKTPNATASKSIREARKSQSAKIQAALYQIADAASAVTDMQSFYKKLHKIVGELMYAENFVIILFDAITNTRSYPYYSDSAGDVAPPSGPVPTQSLLAELIRHPRTLHYNRQQSEEAIRRGEMFGTPSENFVGVPFKMGDQIIGGIIVQSYIKELAYSDEDVSVLEFVAQHIAVALTRARAIEETRQRNSELQIINSIQEGLAAELDFQAIVDVVGDKLCEILRADTFGILFYDPKTDQDVIPYAVNRGERFFPPAMPSGDGISGHVLKSGETMVFNRDFDAASQKYNSEMLVEDVSTKSGVYVPIIAGNKIIGVVSAQSYEEDAYPESTVRLLEIVAGHMGTALENARLFDEVQKRNLEITEALEQQTATSNVLRVIAESPADVQPVLDVVAEYGARLSTSVECAIFLVVDKDKIQLAAQAGPDRLYPLGSQFALNHESIAGTAILDRTVCHVPDIEDTGDRFPLSKSVQIKYRAFLGVPLMRESHCIGAIFIRRPEAGPFSEKQVNLVKIFADQAVIAIENVRLFTETQRLLKETEQRNAELAVINEIGQGLAKEMNFQAIIDLVGDKVRNIFSAQATMIFLYNATTNILSYPYFHKHGQRFHSDPRQINPQMDPGFLALIIRTQQRVVINQDLEQEMLKIGESLMTGTAMFESMAFVPILAGDQVIGVLGLESKDKNAFPELAVNLLTTIAANLGVALENARLWEQEKLFRKALQRELDIGREIQAGFLPDELPHVVGWEIAASLMSAREVAGDFYDAFELPDGNIGLVIADVCDKGVGAALFMTLFRSLVRAAANLDYFEHTQQESAPHSAAERLQRAMSLTNNYIAETHGESGMFATLFFGILDPRDGKLAYINGGHEPPLIIQAGVVRETLRKTGPAVGALTYARFEILETQIHPGDMFFAFTDGVPDCGNPRGEFFGRERLLDSLGRRNGSAPELVADIESELRQYIASSNQFDDITLLAVRRLGI